jgi:hypothetical protein
VHVLRDTTTIIQYVRLACMGVSVVLTAARVLSAISAISIMESAYNSAL